MDQRIDCPTNYIIEPEGTIKAFGCNYTYHKMTRVESQTEAVGVLEILHTKSPITLAYLQ